MWPFRETVAPIVQKRHSPITGLIECMITTVRCGGTVPLAEVDFRELKRRIIKLRMENPSRDRVIDFMAAYIRGLEDWYLHRHERLTEGELLREIWKEAA